MSTEVYRFEFRSGASAEDAESTLHIAQFAAEGLFGAASVRLQSGYYFDEPRRSLIVDGSNAVAAIVVRIFVGLLLRELGEAAFNVRRVSPPRGSEQVGRKKAA
jgi:hypothetical protein